MLTYKNYTSALHDELVAFLNNNMEFDTLTSALLYEKMEGDPEWNPGLAIIALENGHLRGFAMGVVRDVRGTRYGYIKLMAVEKSFRRNGVGTELYRLIEKEFIQQDVQTVRLYDTPLNYFMPGIDPRYTPAVCMAFKLGFKQFGEAVNMTVDLTAQQWDTAQQETALVQQGITIRRATEQDTDAILDFTRCEWELWENEIRQAVSNHLPTIHIALQDGKVKAFAAHDANNKGTGWFGPMGTHSDLRGKGIGAILLKRCLQDMTDEGYTHCTIPWVAPIAFYSHYVGASISRVFWRFEKQLI